MAEQKHPITPPQELVTQWLNEWIDTDGDMEGQEYIATQSANWGDEQRLNAVCEWLHYNYPAVNCAALRAAMHPEPPSLAEQGLEALDEMDKPLGVVTGRRCDTIRTALVRLQELELEKINE